MSKQEYESFMRNQEVSERGDRMQKTGDEGEATTGGFQVEETRCIGTGSDPGPVKEQVSAIGGAKKKRNIVAIGAEDEGDNQRKEERKQLKAKKGKKVKLSFDEAS